MRQRLFPILTLLLALGAAPTPAGAAGRKIEMARFQKVVGLTADGKHAILHTKFTRTLFHDSGLQKTEGSSLVLIRLTGRRTEKTVCKAATQRGCPADLPAIRKANYRALRRLALLDPEAYKEQPGDKTARGHKLVTTRRGRRLHFSLVRGKSVIKLGSTPALSDKLQEPPDAYYYSTHRVLVISLQETTADDALEQLVFVGQEVPFHVVLPASP